MQKRKKTGGRQKGVPNKSTAATKAALQEAFEKIGSVPALAAWALQNQTEFYKLWVKLLPQELTGEDGNAIDVKHTITWLK